jgi:tetratricopeptide (TPR) repeat protein
MEGPGRTQLHGTPASDKTRSQVGRSSMRARPRPPIRLLLLLQAEERTGHLIWRDADGERALLLASGLVVGAEGQPESFLEYLARACRIPPNTLGRIERRVRDLFLPVEGEIARATGLSLEEIAATRRDFTLRQVAELCLREDDPTELRFDEDAVVLPGAACQVPPATALADLLMERLAHEGPILAFPQGGLRPTRLFPRLSVLLELAFPWRIPLPRAGGESAAAILERCGADRAAALYLLVAGGLLAEEARDAERRKPPTILPGVALPAIGGPLATLEALEARLAEDPFNQEAIEALERLAAEEGWPEVLVEMQERLVAKAPPPQRGYYFLRLAALADVAALPSERHAEIVLLGRRSLPRDVRLACAQAFEAFGRGDAEGAQRILFAAGIKWPPAGETTRQPRHVQPSSPELIVRPEPSGLGAALMAFPGGIRTPPPAEAPVEVAAPLVPSSIEAPAPSPIEARPAEPPTATVIPAVPAPTVISTAPAPAAAQPRDTADFSDVVPDSLAPLMAALQAGDEDTLHAWMSNSLPELPRVRRASQAILDAAQVSGSGPKEHIARFAKALERALDELDATTPDSERLNLRADLFVQLADLLAPIDPAAALVAAERAVRADPDHEKAAEKLERLAIDQRDAEAYARGFAGVEEHIEGAHNKWAFAYRQGRTLETEFARNDLALRAYMRALGYQPRTGAVLAAVERLTKATGDNTPQIDAYKLLAAASDGAQRAYWRSRLAELGVVGPVAAQDTDWADMLDESAPGGHARAKPPESPSSSADGESRPVERLPADLERGAEPARGIEEALLRATPALGISILQLQLPPEEPVAETHGPAVPPAAPAPVVQTAPTTEPEPQPLPAASEPAPPAPAAPTTEPEPQPLPAATEPGRPPMIFLEPVFVEEAKPAEPPVKDVSWLDDDVEMVIEYPDAEPKPAATAPETSPPATAPTTATATAETTPAAASEPSTPATTTTATTTTGRVEVGEQGKVLAAQARLDDDVTDLDALRVLAAHWKAAERPVAAWVADAVLSVCDATIVPVPPEPAPAAPTEAVLGKCGPWDARFMHRAMAVVWEHCAGTFAEELPAAIRPAHQVSPMGRDTLAHGIADCSDKLAFFRFQVYRRAEGADLDVLRTRPPSVLVGPSLDPSRSEDLTRLAVGVARCVPEHLLPSTLAPAEREALLQGLLCAFGPPGCVARIGQRAATVAQDLWHFVPPRAQAMLRTELAGADVADSSAWLTEVHARCLTLGVRVSRDARAAIRLGLALDAAVPVERKLTETELHDALRWSSVTRRLLRALLSDGFQHGFAR